MGKQEFQQQKNLKRFNAKIFCWDDNAKIRRKKKVQNFPLFKFWL